MLGDLCRDLYFTHYHHSHLTKAAGVTLGDYEPEQESVMVPVLALPYDSHC